MSIPGLDGQPAQSAMTSRDADLRVIARTVPGESPAEFDLSVTPGDIDHMGHVNNAVYLSWVQDVVVKYWLQLASEAEIASHLWVALTHEITYRKPAFLGDGVYASIKATGVKGARAAFSTVIRRGDDILTEIKSVWCCIDNATQRPKRIASETSKRFLGSAVALTD